MDLTEQLQKLNKKQKRSEHKLALIKRTLSLSDPENYAIVRIPSGKQVPDGTTKLICSPCGLFHSGSRDKVVKHAVQCPICIAKVTGKHKL